jgi:polyisoprenoid-binding protein YceI
MSVRAPVICLAIAVTTLAVAESALPRFVGDAKRGSLGFEFVQAGAATRGAFARFSTELRYDEKNLAASGLAVTVQIDSLDTKDKDRDGTLRSADLFDAAKYPNATFVAKSLAKRADGGLDAVGKLTIRGVTRDLRLPLKLTLKREASSTVVSLTGETTIKRLAFGVGQGDWRSTEWVPDEVKVIYTVHLLGAPASKK